jgi:hypothetical protein
MENSASRIWGPASFMQRVHSLKGMHNELESEILSFSKTRMCYVTIERVGILLQTQTNYRAWRQCAIQTPRYFRECLCYSFQNHFVSLSPKHKHINWGPFLGAFAKLRNATISFVMSVCPQGTTRLPLDRFSWNLIFEDFSKICRKISSFIKMWQEKRVLYVKTWVHLW